MKDFFKKEFLKLKEKTNNNQEILEKFLKKLDDKKGLIRPENPQDHICVYFLPFELTSKSIYLGFHKKADFWIPPGGHIEENESPVETIRREFFEELDYKLVDEKIELFDLTIIDIKNPKQICKRHWDMWYLVHMRKIDFKFDKREFYAGRWYKIEKSLPLIKFEDYKATIKKLLRLF